MKIGITNSAAGVLHNLDSLHKFRTSLLSDAWNKDIWTADYEASRLQYFNQHFIIGFISAKGFNWPQQTLILEPLIYLLLVPA